MIPSSNEHAQPNILLVEDNVIVAFDMQQRLQNWLPRPGHRHVGEDAVSTARAQTAELLIAHGCSFSTTSDGISYPTIPDGSQIQSSLQMT